jgi:hypothetical protein
VLVVVVVVMVEEVTVPLRRIIDITVLLLVPLRKKKIPLQTASAACLFLPAASPYFGSEFPH